MMTIVSCVAEILSKWPLGWSIYYIIKVSSFFLVSLSVFLAEVIHICWSEMMLCNFEITFLSKYCFK